MPEISVTQDQRALVRGLAAKLRRELSLAGDPEDLIAYGFGGLLEARRKFDASRGVRFKTYAYHRVRGAMLDGVRKMAPLSKRAADDARAQANREVTARPTPLDRAFMRISANLTDATPLHGRYGAPDPESLLMHQQSLSQLLQALKQLPERHRRVIRARYFEGRQLDDVARELGVSKSWASRLHGQALRRLRAELLGDLTENSAK
jgi:RNA polymerase sigma factor for flagellar operon FliA